MSLPIYSSKPFRFFGIAIALALLLLWTTNAFLRLPFDLDPRLLRKPSPERGAGSGFEGVEALVNDEGGSGGNAGNAGDGESGWSSSWIAGKDKAVGKLWFFGKAGVEAGYEDTGGRLDDGDIANEAVEVTSKILRLPATKVSGDREKLHAMAATGTRASAAAARTSADEGWFRSDTTVTDALLPGMSAAESGALKGKNSVGGMVDASPLSTPLASPTFTEPDESLYSKEHSETTRATRSASFRASFSTVLSRPAAHPLILYAFAASDWALPNLRFFLTHALHSHATFIFILNGAVPLSTDTSPLAFEPDTRLLNASAMIQSYATLYPNIKLVNRPNTCYDLGAFAEVLLSTTLPGTLNLATPSSSSSNTTLFALHTRFILLNASLRGPFIPFWSRACWSNAYLRPVDEGQRDWKGRLIKIVGMTMNCVAGRPRHLQSMILAGDAAGIGVILGLKGERLGESREGDKVESGNSSNARTMSNIGLDACPATYDSAVSIEASLTRLLLAHNYTVSAMMALAHVTPDYVETCTNGDVNFAAGAYEGGSLSIWETMWIKTRWGVDGEYVERVSGWLDESVGYNREEGEVGRGRSWDVC